MARRKTTGRKRQIESYAHRDERRINNPPVGLVTPETDPDTGEKATYAYDPHLDPQLDWAGKVEHTSFEVPTVSLHVHERIDPRTIIEAVKKRNGSSDEVQFNLFDVEREEPLREAVDFYKHAHGWSNRLVAGDSLLVMNSLLEKEGMAGKVQMVYFDPPYGINYGSNFQPFVNKSEVRDDRDENLTTEPEQIRAFRDTWQLGIHSYLSYMRDRLLLARELLSESGSIFVQISDENLHHIREILDEVFGRGNMVSMISYRTSAPLGSKYIPHITDYICWYAKNKDSVKFKKFFTIKESEDFNLVETKSGEIKNIRDIGRELREDDRLFSTITLVAAGPNENTIFPVEYEGKMWSPTSGRGWKTTKQGMENIRKAGRLYSAKTVLRYKYYFEDFPYKEITNTWLDTAGASDKIYVVQTSPKVIQRCMLMATDPGDLVFDPTCGSGTTAYVAEQWGRRWITCDTSRVALTPAKQRLMTAMFDYYELAHPSEGVGSGFKYKTVPHVTLGSIANNPDIKEGMTHEEIDAAIARHAPQETLSDQPLEDNKKTRVSGPFTVEAVPAPVVKSVEEVLEGIPQPADASIARSGETLRQSEWRDELLRSGIRGKGAHRLRFARLEPLPGCRWLHADGEISSDEENEAEEYKVDMSSAAQRIVVSFGPEHAPLEQRQVAQAIEEGQTLVPKPNIIVFAAFQFDPEAAKDIDETKWPGVVLLKAWMNADLLTEDLKKNRASNESFWLIGQPDVQVDRVTEGEDEGKIQVSVHGFDYYNPRTGGVESGDQNKIAVWLLDTDYDGRSLYPRQVFFPMAGTNGGWARLAKNLKAEIDEGLIEAYRGTQSLPFEPGEHGRIAVKIVDDRGIESLKVIEVEE